MKDKENKDFSAPFASAVDSDELDSVFLYENALKNLRRELEEKQNLIAHLRHETVRKFSNADFGGSDEYVYAKNKDMTKKLKEYAADMLIGELKSISSSMRRKLNEMDEKENRLATRLIEIEERQAILEEIDYVQRMIPKKILEEKMQQSVEAKQAAETDVKEIFRPAVHMILQKEQALKEKKCRQVQEETTTKKVETPAEADALEVKKATDTTIAPESQSEGLVDTTTDVYEKTAPILEPEQSLAQQAAPVAEEQKEFVQPSDEAAVIDFEQAAAQIRKTAQDEQSLERTEKNFSYISDSKIKLKPEDMLSIQKAIRSIEQGRFAVQGD